MLHTITPRRDDHRHYSHQGPVLVSVAERFASNSMLARYLDGWAGADPTKIGDATAHDYDFHDPLVGHFSRCTLPQYFRLLRSRFGIAGIATRRDLAFTLRGPMSSAPPKAAHRQHYWREAPLLGLTGFSEIVVTHRGVVAETVAYDLNIACETLRGSGPQLLQTCHRRM